MPFNKTEFGNMVYNGGYCILNGIRVVSDSNADTHLIEFISDDIPLDYSSFPLSRFFPMDSDRQSDIDNNYILLRRIIDSVNDIYLTDFFHQSIEDAFYYQAIPQKLYLQFSRIGTIEELLQFVNRFGLLTDTSVIGHAEKYSKYYFDTSVEMTWPQHDSVNTCSSVFKLDTQYDRTDSKLPLRVGEPIEFWWYEIREMRLVIELRDYFTQNISPARLKQLKTDYENRFNVIHGEIITDKDRRSEFNECDSFTIEDIVNTHLFDYVYSQLVRLENEYILIHHPDNLLGYMWLQFANTLTSQNGITLPSNLCVQCGKPLVRMRSTRLFCGAACRMAHHRKMKKQKG